ncbi:ABC transporter substrate-binding protein [Microlunatus soli]|uniref:Carbohydrate ABC transporter substrate-binding protein, CUT1 family n=1 Tax=Microlunatus soli TaxID=630515 RepID=A0A1H1MI68_9ACTN|nr:sugar ABC transporter substrate-binding protein [Microlunatus soli]SDR86347.1 carbohydrate ABC transporter substrate-binding protein, CUT1 family [Microlunatus soli]
MNRSWMRRLSRPLVAVAALATVAGVTACGSGTPGQSADQANGEKTVVEFWQGEYTTPENAWYKKVVADFNASHPKISVKATTVPGDAWDQKMKAAQAAGKAPDVYPLPGRLTDPVRLGQVHEMDSLMPEKVWENLNPKADDVVSVDGKHYAYPLLLEPQQVLFTNSEMFTKAGLDPKKPPTTWKDLLAACAKIKPTLSNGQFCLQTAADPDTFAWTSIAQQLQVAGHLPLSDDWSKAQATDPKYKQLITFFKTLYDKGYIPKQPLGPGNDVGALGEKKVAMSVNGSWGMSQIAADFPEVAPNISMAPMATPTGDQTKNISPLGNFKWVIDAKSKHPKEAAEFIQWVLAGDPEVLKPFFVDTKFTKVPARNEVAELVAKDQDASNAPWASMLTEDVVPNAVLETDQPYDVSKAMGTAIQKGMTGTDPDTALQEAQKTITQVIKRDKLAGKGGS